MKNSVYLGIQLAIAHAMKHSEGQYMFATCQHENWPKDINPITT